MSHAPLVNNHEKIYLGFGPVDDSDRDDGIGLSRVGKLLTSWNKSFAFHDLTNRWSNST
jgi:hypothetical protein